MEMQTFNVYDPSKSFLKIGPVIKLQGNTAQQIPSHYGSWLGIRHTLHSSLLSTKQEPGRMNWKKKNLKKMMPMTSLMNNSHFIILIQIKLTWRYNVEVRKAKNSHYSMFWEKNFYLWVQKAGATTIFKSSVWVEVSCKGSLFFRCQIHSLDQTP